MNDNTRIKKAPHDTEQPLVQKDSVSDAEFCLSEMKKISQLIETVSQPKMSLRLNVLLGCLCRCQFY